MNMPVKAAEIMEAVIARGDLAQLTPDERSKFYMHLCESVGLNPMTRPFEYIELDGKLTLYCRKDATDQLRNIHGVSIEVLKQGMSEDCFVVHVRAVNKAGRQDEDFGSVEFTYPQEYYHRRDKKWVKHPKAGQQFTGKDRANGTMKAITKAKRRVTLSICGLGFLDETELETIAQPEPEPRILKKDTRELYNELQAELDDVSTCPEAMNTWGKSAAERIATLAPDFQTKLRSCYEFKLAELKDGREATRCGEILAEQWGNKQGGSMAAASRQTTVDVSDRVIWTEDGERPMTAADELADGDFTPVDPKAAKGEKVNPPVNVLVGGDNWDFYEGFAQ